MASFKIALLSACMMLAQGMHAQASPVTYSDYSVLNNQNVTLNDAALGVSNEYGGSGQVTLTGTNTLGGSLATFCVDILHELLNSGVFTNQVSLAPVLNAEVNALMTHVIPTLASDYNASSALQVAIWTEEYGPGLTISAASGVLSLAKTYLANVSNGSWKADPTMTIAVLSGAGITQDQAYLTAVPEPASIILFASGLLGAGLIRRRMRRKA